jgi:hypothetical protein
MTGVTRPSAESSAVCEREDDGCVYAVEARQGSARSHPSRLGACYARRQGGRAQSHMGVMSVCQWLKLTTILVRVIAIWNCATARLTIESGKVEALGEGLCGLLIV